MVALRAHYHSTTKCFMLWPATIINIHISYIYLLTVSFSFVLLSIVATAWLPEYHATVVTGWPSWASIFSVSFKEVDVCYSIHILLDILFSTNEMEGNLSAKFLFVFWVGSLTSPKWHVYTRSMPIVGRIEVRGTTESYNLSIQPMRDAKGSPRWRELGGRRNRFEWGNLQNWSSCNLNACPPMCNL